MNFKPYSTDLPFEMLAGDIIDFISKYKLIKVKNIPYIGYTIKYSQNIDEQVGQFLREILEKNVNNIPNWLKDWKDEV